MSNLFNSVKIKNPKRNKFNLSRSVRLTTEFGRITPVMCEPVLPADKFTISSTLSVKFAPMTFPVMERFKAYLHFWYVPTRIIWDNWEDFITGGEDGLQDQVHSYPVIRVDSGTTGDDSGVLNSNFAPGSLFDYLGFPTAQLNDMMRWNSKDFDALPFKAYQKIYDEFYRDQNLEAAMDLHEDRDGNQDLDDDGAFINGLMSIRYRAWKKDYFTSALPDPQRGPDVTLPLFGDMKIQYNSPTTSDVVEGRITKLRSITGQVTENATLNVGNNAGTDAAYLRDSRATNYDVDNSSRLTGKLSDIRSASINDVRRGFSLQRLYELAARVGGRYAENILGNFGVHAGDARLQRPEYLGGSSVPIYVGDVLQTSESGETPLGMPAGVAGALGECKEFSKTFYEHGFILGLLTIMPEASYIQGIPRKYLKRDRLDFAWPLLANLGEQEIQNQELYFSFFDEDNVNKAGFGYTPRYAEYKFGLNSIHGDFRTSLADFHDARIFSSRPVLNSEFIKVKPTGNDTGINRIFAVTGTDENPIEYDHLWVNIYHNVLVRRKLPKYGTPI